MPDTQEKTARNLCRVWVDTTPMTEQKGILLMFKRRLYSPTLQFANSLCVSFIHILPSIYFASKQYHSLRRN